PGEVDVAGGVVAGDSVQELPGVLLCGRIGDAAVCDAPESALRHLLRGNAWPPGDHGGVGKQQAHHEALVVDSFGTMDAQYDDLAGSCVSSHPNLSVEPQF